MSSTSCRFYNSPSGCRYGDNCGYSHDSNTVNNNTTLCRYFYSSSGCRYGKQCRYKHVSMKSDQDHINKLLLCVQGYYRNICKKEFIHNDIAKVIINYNNSMNIYLETLCSSEQHKKLGLQRNKLDLNYFHWNKFNISKCVNCLKLNCLEFKKCYQQQWKHTDCNIPTFKNNANEYQCKLCKYYIALNVKIKVLSSHSRSSGNGTNEHNVHSFVTPFRQNMNEQIEIQKNTTNGTGHCGQCKRKDIITFKSVNKTWTEQRYTDKLCHSKSEYIWYCERCDLFTHHNQSRTSPYINPDKWFHT
eukprot:193496_1